MSETIFYSWQSDLPNATNRSFIQLALERAVKELQTDTSLLIEPVVDRDTFGVPGSPDIATTIFNKIDQCQVFVADVSLINSASANKLTPNPNVLIELGYAIKTLGWNRLILIMNRVFGEPPDLPFDLRMKRIVTYYMPENQQDRSSERKILQSKLTEGLRLILDAVDTPVQETGVQEVLYEYTVSLTGNGKYQSLTEAIEDGVRTITVEAGEYSENIDLTQPGLIIRGSGSSCTVIDGGKSGPALRINASNIVVSDLAFKTEPGCGNPFDAISIGDSSPVSDFELSRIKIISSDDHGISIGLSSNCRHGVIKNSKIFCTDSEAIVVDNSYRIDITENQIQDIGNLAIDLRSKSQYCRVEYNEIVDGKIQDHGISNSIGTNIFPNDQ